MIQVNNISLAFGGRTLYKDVNLKFTKGNCYGIIGANGAGKSTFLKILTGELEPSTGDVFISPGERMSVLQQNQNAFDNETVLDTVLLGHKRLMEIQHENDKACLRRKRRPYRQNESCIHEQGARLMESKGHKTAGGHFREIIFGKR